jgi:hypothetical protein
MPHYSVVAKVNTWLLRSAGLVITSEGNTQAVVQDIRHFIVSVCTVGGADRVRILLLLLFLFFLGGGGHKHDLCLTVITNSNTITVTANPKFIVLPVA